MILFMFLFFIQRTILSETKIQEDVSNIAQFLQSLPAADRPIIAMDPKANGNFLHNNYDYAHKVYKTASIASQAAVNPLEVLNINEGRAYGKQFEPESFAKENEDNQIQNMKNTIYSLKKTKINPKSLLNWLESLFKVTKNENSIEDGIVTTDSTTQSTTVTTPSPETTTEENTASQTEAKGLISVYDLGVAIDRLYDILKIINDNIVKQNQQLATITDRIYVFRLPNSDGATRAKRSVTYGLNSENELPRVKRSTNDTDALNKDVTCNITRRSLEPEQNSLSEVRLKLLAYIDEGFKDIEQKINGLKPIKETYSKDNVFMIGYIVANVDTLENNVKNLKMDVDNGKELWNDKKILEIFDSLKVSGKILSNLMESLSTYIRKTQSNET